MAYKSPLSPFLAPELISAPPKQQPRKLKTKLMMVAFAACFPFLGTSFASPITISNQQIEFGQGSTQLVQCDSSITVDFPSTYTSGAFYVSAIQLGDLDYIMCHDKTLRISVLDANGASLLPHGDYDYVVQASPDESGFTTEQLHTVTRSISVNPSDTPIELGSIARVSIQTLN